MPQYKIAEDPRQVAREVPPPESASDFARAYSDLVLQKLLTLSGVRKTGYEEKITAAALAAGVPDLGVGSIASGVLAVSRGIHKRGLAEAPKTWRTPKEIAEGLIKRFKLDWDVAASHENALLPKYYTAEENALKQDWAGKRVWLNPPYGPGIERWMRKALEESRRGATVVALVPDHSSGKWSKLYGRPIKWWDTYASQADEIIPAFKASDFRNERGFAGRLRQDRSALVFHGRDEKGRIIDKTVRRKKR